MDKRDFTPEEIDALPSGSMEMRTRPVTPEDIERGVLGATITTPHMRPVHVRVFRDGDPIAYYDTRGRLWQVGQWADTDEYYKEFVG